MSQYNISNKFVFYKSLCFRIKTSELAFKFYLSEKTYATPHVILSLKKEMLFFLREIILYAKSLDKKNLTDQVVHFTGWISDFELQLKLQMPEPDSIFVFKKSKGLLLYPKEFIEKLYVDWYSD